VIAAGEKELSKQWINFTGMSIASLGKKLSANQLFYVNKTT